MKKGMSKNKIKIILTTNDFLIGGAQKLIIDTLNTLEGEPFEFYVITLKQFDGQGTFYGLIPGGTPIYKLNFKSFWDFREWIELIKILAKIKPDIVKSALFFSNTIFRILKPLFRYKVIVAEHNTEVKRSVTTIIINKFLSVFSYKIVADSRTVAKFLIEKEGIDRSRIQVIYNGVELRDIKKSIKELGPKREEIRSSLGISSGDRVFLNIARFTTQKDHRMLVESFGLLAKKRDDIKLIIIGDGRLRGDIEHLIEEKKLSDKIFLLGEKLDLHKYYIASDYFALSSRREGFCIVAMNALAFGRPLVTTKVAGVIEYVENAVAGFFSEHSTIEFSRAMERALNLTSEEYDKFGREAEAIADSFSLDKYAETYKKLFNECFFSN